MELAAVRISFWCGVQRLRGRCSAGSFPNGRRTSTSTAVSLMELPLSRFRTPDLLSEVLHLSRIYGYIKQQNAAHSSSIKHDES